MVTNYLLSCESTADLPYEPVCSRGLSVLPYPYSLDGKVYMDDMGRDPEGPERVCRALKAGNAAAGKPGMREYCRYFRSLLSKGDVLHIALGSGMGDLNVPYALLAGLKERKENLKSI